MTRRTAAYMALILLLACAKGAHAANCYVTEFIGYRATAPVYYQAAYTPFVAQQVVTFTSSSVQSSAFNIDTGMIRVQCDAVTNLVIGGTSPTATTTSMRMTAGQTEYFIVKAGDKLAAIAGT